MTQMVAIRLAIVITVSFFCLRSYAVHAGDPPPHDRFSDAASKYERALSILNSSPQEASDLLDQAIADFLAIADSLDATSAALEFNLGNAYLHKGEIGIAIYHFRRAELLNASLPGLAQNLSIARAQVSAQFYHSDGIGTSIRREILSGFEGQLNMIAAWLFIGFWSLGWLLALLYSQRLFVVPKWIIVATFAAAMLPASVLIASLIIPEPRIGVVMDEEVVARTGPDERGYPSAFSNPVSAGVEIVIVEERGNWLYVSFADGRRAWLPAQSVRGI